MTALSAIEDPLSLVEQGQRPRRITGETSAPGSSDAPGPSPGPPALKGPGAQVERRSVSRSSPLPKRDPFAPSPIDLDRHFRTPVNTGWRRRTLGRAWRVSQGLSLSRPLPQSQRGDGGDHVAHVTEAAGRPAPRRFSPKVGQGTRRVRRPFVRRSVPVPGGCCRAARERNKPYPHGRLEALHPPLPDQKTRTSGALSPASYPGSGRARHAGAASAWAGLQSNRLSPTTNHVGCARRVCGGGRARYLASPAHV